MDAPIVVHNSSAPSLVSGFNPRQVLGDLWRHRDLTLQLAYREIVNRYRASWLGLAWTALNPLVLLAIYTFVFAEVLKMRWGDTAADTTWMFALTMFAGMLVFNLFAEVTNRAPRLVVDQPNYVKRVVFPLENLIVATVLAALFNLAIGVVVWLLGWLLIQQSLPHATVLWLPIVLLPVCITTAGLAWLLAAVGVFVRDLTHAVVLATQVLFFATPIFYSMERIPEAYRPVALANPLTHAVVNARRVMLDGQAPNLAYLGVSFAFAVLIGLTGYAVFVRHKRAFADVV